MISNLKDEIQNLDTSYFISKWILEKTPQIFCDDLQLYIQWKQLLASKLGVDSKAIAIIGSAAVGFSLNPAKQFRLFSAKSDVDVAIVSDHYFDISWHFLRNLGPKIFSYSQKEKNSIDDHRLRLIYWGTIATDKIIQILPFGERWIKAANDMSNENPTIGREINLRIYKDFDALRAYHTIGIKQIKDQLIIN